jgi:hypothetical protein
MAILPKATLCSMQSLPEFQWHSSQRLNNHYNIHTEAQKTTNSQGNTELKRAILEISKYLNLNYRATAIKTAWYWHKNRHEDQWKRTDESNINPHSHSHLIFDKGSKNIQQRKDSPFNKFCWGNWIFVCRRLKLDPCLSPCINIYSKWIKNINVRPEILKLLRKEQGINWNL